MTSPSLNASTCTDSGLHKGVAMGTAKWMLRTAAAGVIGMLPWIASGEGLKADPDTVPWTRWQARLAVGTSAPWWRNEFGGYGRSGPTVSSLSLMGDYYFTRSIGPTGSAGGFRATSGLILGPRSGLWTGRPTAVWPGALNVERRLFDVPASSYGVDAMAETTTLPYVGVGYSGLSARGGWSVSADLGVVALAPASAVKLGRTINGTQGLDELLRELRLSPVIQFGVSYSF